jgi:spore coat protein U-like protein
MKKTLIVLVAVLFVLTVGLAYAASNTANLGVSANVAGKCKVTGVTNIAFGTDYDPTDIVDNDSGAGNFSFKCTKDTVYWTYITGVRQMSDGYGNLLNFELYKEAGRTNVFENSKTGAGTTSPDNTERTISVYGRIPNSQNVPSGTYNKTLVVTVEY